MIICSIKNLGLTLCGLNYEKACKAVTEMYGCMVMKVVEMLRKR